MVAAPLLTYLPYILAAAGGTAAYMNAQTQSKNLETQANAAAANAVNARQVAASESAANVSKENIMREHQRQILGQQRAGMLQAGLNFHGSGGDSAEAAVMNTELDSLMVQHQGALQHIARMNEASMLDFQADSYRSNAASVRRTAPFSILGASAQGFASGYAMQSALTPRLGAGVAGTGAGASASPAISNYTSVPPTV